MYLVWLRVAHFGVHATDQEYEVEQQLVRELISSEDGKLHLKKYLEEWDRVTTRTCQVDKIIDTHSTYSPLFVRQLRRLSGPPKGSRDRMAKNAENVPIIAGMPKHPK